jgi:hypothetical protein
LKDEAILRGNSDFYEWDEANLPFWQWWDQWGENGVFWLDMELPNNPSRPVRVEMPSEGVIIDNLNIVSVAGEQAQLSLVGGRGRVLVWDVKVEIEKVWGCSVLTRQASLLHSRFSQS